LKLEKSIYKVSATILSITRLLAIIGCLSTIIKNKALFIEWEIYSINTTSFVIRIIFDWKSFSFLATVSIISIFIIIYRKYYIEGEKNFTRFIYILLAFVGSIILLIIRPNILSLILGWDGLGLTSYALVIFYQREYSNNSGIITILRNRVGDATLLLTIGGFLHFGSYNFIFIQLTEPLIIFLIILRAFTKRAQIPFSAWLPAAIAAPTPVSALVHSSTLVTAGVYLIIRFIPILKNSQILIIAFVIGVATIIIAGWAANFETDLKKVVALRTLRQLGLIFTILGLGNELLAFFHLIIHALFKSSLFICAGFIIHNTNNRQDRRFAGSFNFSSPILGLVFGCTNISLCGFPFITGFFSKDIILEKTFHLFRNRFIFLLIVFSTGLTLAYRVRAIYITARENRKTPTLSVSRDFSTTLITRTSLLFVLRVRGGYVLRWFILEKGLILSITSIKKFSIIIIIIIITIIILNIIKQKFNFISSHKKWFSSLLRFLPMLTKHPLTVTTLNTGVIALKINDKGWFEYRGPSALALLLKKYRLFVNKSNTINTVTTYILRFIIIILFTILIYYALCKYFFISTKWYFLIN